MTADLWSEDGVVLQVSLPEQIPAHVDVPVERGPVVRSTALTRFHAMCVWRTPAGEQVAVYATRRFA